METDSTSMLIDLLLMQWYYLQIHVRLVSYIPYDWHLYLQNVFAAPLPKFLWCNNIVNARIKW